MSSKYEVLIQVFIVIAFFFFIAMKFSGKNPVETIEQWFSGLFHGTKHRDDDSSIGNDGVKQSQNWGLKNE